MSRTCAVQRMALLILAAIVVETPFNRARAAVLPQTDAQLVALSSLIIEGTVLDVSCAWNATNTQIYTNIDISVDATHKGTLAGQILRLRILGGVVDNIGMGIPHSPEFATSERVIVFLGMNSQSLFPVVGMYQGKFTIDTDPSSGEERVRERNQPRADFLQHFQQLIADEARKAADARQGSKP